jgi:hypothetical protein
LETPAVISSTLDLSYIFLLVQQRTLERTTLPTDLSPDLQHILEAHPHVRQLALEKHDDVRVVLVDLLRRPLLLAVSGLLGEGLEGGDLGVEVGDVLLDDEGELLQHEQTKRQSKLMRISAEWQESSESKREVRKGGGKEGRRRWPYGDLDRSVVEERLPLRH